MPKRQKHKHHRAKGAPQSIAGIGFEGWRAHIEALLARGQTREAVEAAKQYLKEAPGPEAEVLAVEAYQARIQALMASGMHQEARALALLVSERFPAAQGRVAPLIRQSEVASGNFDPLLIELSGATPAQRRELEATLTRTLHDPAVLADSTALPADHPLKRTAITVRDLFTAVTTGPLPDGALAALDEVSRHSPLAPWKLLIRALDALYRGADESVTANLDGIPPDSRPRASGPSAPASDCREHPHGGAVGGCLYPPRPSERWSDHDREASRPADPGAERQKCTGSGGSGAGGAAADRGVTLWAQIDISGHHPTPLVPPGPAPATFDAHPFQGEAGSGPPAADGADHRTHGLERCPCAVG